MVNSIPNSFIYLYHPKKVSLDVSSDSLHLLVKIKENFYQFILDTKDFSEEQIGEVFQKEQIYINIKWGKVSQSFIDDYRKLKNCWNYFEIIPENLFISAEQKVRKILKNIFLGDCLDIGCWETRYRDIFEKKWVNYLWIDIHNVETELPTEVVSFEDFSSGCQFNTLFFFRSINHFSDTIAIFDKAESLLKSGWYLFIVENELFWEIKFQNQMFEWKGVDFEHFHNYTLEWFKKVVNLSNFTIVSEEWVSKDMANQWFLCLRKN